MILGVDCATRLTPKTAAGIKAAGYEFVGRYLVPSIGSMKWKALTKEECEIITGAGLRLLTVWETTADRVKGGAEAGSSDGSRAATLASDFGIPRGAAIYFAVDYDAQKCDFDTIAAYLNAAKKQLRGMWRVGVYGSYNVIEAMKDAEAADCFWQCVAWSYRKKSDHRDVYQAKAGLSCAGVSIDENECENMARAGIWNYDDVFDEDEDDMNVERFAELMGEYRKTLQDNDASDWSQSARDWAVNTGLVQGGSASEFNGMWQDYLTREQMAMLLYRFAQMIGKA